MRKAFLFLLLFTFSFTSFSQDVFDIGIRKIEIFFSEPNWNDTLDLYYANDIGQRLIADSVIGWYEGLFLGDMNNDGTLDILDLVGLANLILSNEYLISGDMNQDGYLNILDIVNLVNVILNQ